MSEIKQVTERFVDNAIRASRIDPIYEWWDVPEQTALSVDTNDPFMNGIVVSITHGTVDDKLHYFIRTIRWP